MSQVNRIKNLEGLVKSLGRRLPGVPEEEIKSRLLLFVQEFKVPAKEAINVVVKNLAKEYDIQPVEAKIESLKDVNSAVVLRVKVVRLFESKSPKVKQVGIIGDETGTTRFAVFRDGIKLEEGKCYQITNALIDEYNDKPNVVITSFTDVREIDGDIEVKYTVEETEFTGAVVAVQGNSGLVERCKECGRVTKKGVCQKHAKTETELAVRAKIVVDNGEKVVQAILDGEQVEKLTGLSLNKAKEIAAEYGREATQDWITDNLVGRYLRLKGKRGTQYLIPSEVEVIA